MPLYNGMGQLVSSETGGSFEYTTVTSNVLDDAKVGRPTSGNIKDVWMDEGYYIECSGHVACASNLALKSVRFYDESFAQISEVTNISGYSGKLYACKIPQNAKYLRANWWAVGGDTHAKYPSTVSETNRVMLYFSESEYPNTDRRTEYVEHEMVDASRIYGELKNAIIPNEGEMMRMIRTQAVRVLNETRNAFRIANFNTYVGRGTGNWDRIGDMLADYGVDICGFEEMQYKEVTSHTEADCHLGHHLIAKRPWQFTSTNETVPDGSTDSPFSNRGMVSRFEIVESTELPWTDIGEGNYNNHSAMYAKIRLPKYLDATGGVQYLGFYAIHPTVTGTNEMQSHEMQTCIDHMATTGNAFNIIAADSNAFHIDPETGEQWLMKWMKEQGFKLVHDSISKTTTDPSPDHGGAIDQLFVSQNINVLNYDIINSYEYLVKDVNGNDVPISDHDFIYADLQFDYSDIVNRCRPMNDIALILNLDNVTSDMEEDMHIACSVGNQYGKRIITLDNDVVVNLTPVRGSLVVTVKLSNVDKTSTYYSNGKVRIPAGTVMEGDITITATTS